MPLTRTALVAIFTVISQPVWAQSEGPKPTPPPPCTQEVYRAFDFWLGDWTVFGIDPETNKKTLAGRNVVSSHENGCLILEHWESAGGGTGQSYNFYDPGLQKWRQIWVSGAATIDYSGGLNDTGEMILEGDIAYRSGTKAPFRGIWSKLEDGKVKQYFQQFNNQTGQWDDWFTGIYEKRPEATSQ